MDSSDALRIIRALADGLDPSSGETCKSETVLQQPQTIRALEKAVGALQSEIERAVRKKSLPPNVGKPWLPPEEKHLCAEFDRGMRLREMARLHLRTYGGIVAHLEKLGKIPPQSRPAAEMTRSDLTQASPAGIGRAWLREEDERLCAEFHGSVDFVEIARHLGRSRKEIVSRLIALGKMGAKRPLSVA